MTAKLNFLPVKDVFDGFQQMQFDADNLSKTRDLSDNLKTIASTKGFILSDNPASGNCMFYALSEQLQSVKGIEISHSELRRSLVSHLTFNAKLVSK